MASRLSNIHEREALKGFRPTAIGELRIRESVRTKLADTYQGPAADMRINFKAFPGLAGTIKGLLLNIPNYKDRILQLEVWQDTDPLFDAYSIRLWLAGDYDIPPQGLSGEGAPSSVGGMNRGVGVLPVLFIPAIIVALGVLSIFGVIAWKASKASWGAAVTGVSALLFVGGIVAIGGLYMLTRTNRSAHG